jgi:hypothetical protein
MKAKWTIAAIVVGLIVTAGIGVAQLGPPGVLLPRQIATHGSIAIHGDELRGQQMTRPWTVQVKRSDDNSFEGRIVLAGVPDFRTGRLYGQISWPSVVGVIGDNHGNELGRFDGIISLVDGIEGRFLMSDGRTGSWWWEWPLRPRWLRELEG